MILTKLLSVEGSALGFPAAKKKEFNYSAGEWVRRKDDRNEPTGDGIVQSCGARKLIDLYILHRGPASDCWLVFFSDKTPRVCSVRNFRKWYRGNGDTNRDSPCPQSLSMKKIHSLSFSATRVIKIFFFLIARSWTAHDPKGHASLNFLGIKELYRYVSCGAYVRCCRTWALAGAL